jgi:dihydrolipoamide dehydrogenase
MDIKDVVVIGGGPGGYAAAFRAKDLGLDVVLIEESALGGVCLNIGCIPSKTYLSVAEKLHDAKGLKEFGIEYSDPKIDVKKLLAKKNSIVKNLTAGLGMLAKKRNLTVIKGKASFVSTNSVKVANDQIQFKHAIIATGSRPNSLPFLPNDKRIFDSTGALELKDIKGHLVIIGGGIIGCEMATIYSALGVKVTILEAMDDIMMGADVSHVKIIATEMEKMGIEIRTQVKISKVNADKRITIYLEDEKIKCDQILYSVGRTPNSDQLSLDDAQVLTDEKGYIPVDLYMQTNQKNIYAIGDIAKTNIDNQMLAHRATAHGHLAAEIIAGQNICYDFKVIPAVAYTDPELAWVGINAFEAKQKGCKIGKFPWLASGRSLAMGQGVGETKIFSDPETGRILGASIVGRAAGELIGVFCLAIEMGATLEDLALTVMPHPTLVETTSLAAEVSLGTITDL